jgi:multiple sugar transport system substrate-binding protein
MQIIKFSLVDIRIVTALAFSILLIAAVFTTTSSYSSSSASSPPSLPSSDNQKKQVTLTAMLDYLGDEKRWNIVFQPALNELRARHPDIDIQLDYRPFPYSKLRTQFLDAMANQTSIDIMSVDQIWLGEFAEKGYLVDLTDYVNNWGRSSDWYETNWDAGVYNDKIYGIWAITDIRGMWYWKDLLNEAGVDPNSLKTWDGYIASAQKLNAALKDKGIQGMHLVGASHSPDMSFYPYLWMLGGDIVERREGHPSKGSYWYPSFNSTEGVRALEFIQSQVNNAGIKPQVEHFSGMEFADRKFAVMLEGSWLLGFFPREQWPDFAEKVGFLPMFPVPNEGIETASLMGGWLLGIPNTSKNKDLAWELLTLMVEPRIITPLDSQYGYLPTQISIGEGPYSEELRKSIPYYDELISMIKVGRTRPSIPEYPEIADHIRQAIDEVYYGLKEPKQALNDAAAKSAKALGW